MTENSFKDVRRLQKAAAAAQHRDGLIELFGGALLLGLGAIWLSNPGIVSIFAALYVIFALTSIERVKQRVTYPRIGYSAPPADATDSSARGVIVFLAAMAAITLVVMALTGGVDSAAQWRRWAPLLFGLMSSGGFLHAAKVSGLNRYYAVATLSIALGALIGWSHDGGNYSGVAVHLLVLGAVLLAVGMEELARFVRTHPKMASDG
jgi:hypothetical protein